jgi:hypothetical protein
MSLTLRDFGRQYKTPSGWAMKKKKPKEKPVVVDERLKPESSLPLARGYWLDIWWKEALGRRSRKDVKPLA